MLSKRFVLSCLYLLIFYFDKISTSICPVPLTRSRNNQYNMALSALNKKCDKQQQINDKQQMVNLENFCILTTKAKYNDLQAKQLLLLSCVTHYTEILMEAYI